MKISNVSFSSLLKNNNNNISYKCSGCGKKRLNPNCYDAYIKEIKDENKNLQAALRFACKIIAANE